MRATRSLRRSRRERPARRPVRPGVLIAREAFLAPARLWIRLPNWLGDGLMSRPLLGALGALRPDIVVRAAGPRDLVDLIATDGWIDELEAWPEDGRSRRALERRVRAWKPDAALVLPPSFSSALSALRSGAPQRVGFASEARSPLLTAAWRRPSRGDLHLAVEYLALGASLARLHSAFAALDRLDTRAALEVKPLAVGDQGHDAATALRGSLGPANAPLALIAPGALYGPAKRWSAERYAALARRLRARGFAVAVSGTPGERAICERVAAEGGEGVRSIAGQTSLATLAALGAESSLAVCNDSGFAHLAAAVGAPTVVIFGSTSSAWSAPLGARVRVIQRAPVCSPCFQRGCRIGYRCLEAIEVAAVEAECVALAA